MQSQSCVNKNVYRTWEPLYSNVAGPYAEQCVHFWIISLLWLETYNPLV